MDEHPDRAAARTVDDGDLAAEVAQRVAGDGQAHADADRVLAADEGLEKLVADFRVDAVARGRRRGSRQICHPFAAIDQAGADGQRAGHVRRVVVGLPGVDQHPGKHVLEHLGVRFDHQVAERNVDADRSGKLVVAMEARDPALQQRPHAGLDQRGPGVDDERTELADDGDDALQGRFDVRQDLFHLLRFS